MDKERIRNDVAIVLYRIVQEVLNNIIKHADANTVKVTMHSRGNRIKLSVCDNGKGFDIGKTLGGAKRHMGLRAMREMAECLKGRFDIKSEPGKGTEVSINLHAHKEI